MAHDILIVDDENDIRSLIADILQDEGYITRTASDSDSAIQAIRERTPHLLIQDIWLEGSPLDGLQILQQVKAEHPDLPVVMISGHGNIETAVASIQMGAYDFIEKPFDSDRLLLIVRRAVEAAQLRRENAELRLKAGTNTELLGDSPLITQLRQIIEKVSATSSRVLISGPPGSGKEVVARLIHLASARQSNPFVALNCATLSPEQVEIELFGTEHGENGSARKVGTMERAHGGTLLLDEVADMPLETQSKIVRVLQEQSFERVGGSNRVQVDVRVIASSSKNLQEEMTLGRFREDLYYRLSVVPIRVPALRERREDIPLLARYFIQRGAESAGLVARSLGEDTVTALQTYDWPGNVRQLRNIIDWLLIMAPGQSSELIRADMLPPEVGSNAPAVLKWDKGSEIMNLALREARELFEREYLLAQITRFSGNISRTANFVGMERSALHRKLKLLGVQTKLDA
ncbi:MAG: sigma-54 dependent transcriptional regulator [Alphaproteobacteria bacterium]